MSESTLKALRADLHVHTYYSDGSQSPEDVVAAARRTGVDVVSVTDHDNSNGTDKVRELCKKAGVISVDGEEISAYDKDVKVHILAYNMNRRCESYQSFHKRLIDGAEVRCFEILKKLSLRGIKISYGDVIRERKCEKSPLHATYIATAGARKGYAQSPWDFYARYLNYGMPGFSYAERPTPEETVQLISDCGGISSLAHPGRITLSDDALLALLKRLTDKGLLGIEAVYSGHTDEQTQYYKELAERYSLYITGGSDTHHAGGGRRVGVPYFCPDERLLSALKII